MKAFSEVSVLHSDSSQSAGSLWRKYVSCKGSSLEKYIVSSVTKPDANTLGFLIVDLGGTSRASFWVKRVSAIFFCISIDTSLLKSSQVHWETHSSSRLDASCSMYVEALYPFQGYRYFGSSLKSPKGREKDRVVYVFVVVSYIHL